VCGVAVYQDVMTEALNTHDVVIDYGRHRGERFTRLPISYLKWMVRESAPQHEYAKSELTRRGTSTPAIEVSGHAIDRFSQRFLGIWQQHCEMTGETVGLWSYLNRLAGEAWHYLQTDPEVDAEGDRVVFIGITWVFATNGQWPVVKSVM